MKALSKPISSPSRAENFPPPLMRFLKSNNGSRSRGRSRSSPIFYIPSKRNSAEVIETTQEPSSPKVTCIGQVRASRSAKSKARKSGGAAVNSRRSSWLVKKALFCRKISSKFRSQKGAFRIRRIFCKWVLFLRSGYCKKVDTAEDSFRVHSNQKSENLVGGHDRNSSCSSVSESEFYSKKHENLEIRAQESKRDFLDVSSSPPKNALILTRCRSAPYRSSSLVGRFWSSDEAENYAKSEELQKPSCENKVEDSRISQESSQELDNPVKNVQGLKGIEGGAVHPLLLTRCNSEPARTGERLNPEANFWRQRRLG